MARVAARLPKTRLRVRAKWRWSQPLGEAVVGLVSLEKRIGLVDQNKDQAAEILDMEDREAALGRQGDEAAARHLEQFERLAVAGAVDRRRPDDRPVETRGRDEALRSRLRPAVIGKLGLARGQRGEVDEAADSGAAGGVDHGRGAADIDRLEAGAGAGR